MARSGRRAVLVMSSFLAALAIVRAAGHVQAGPPLFPGLVRVQEDYLDTENVNLAVTTAVVDTQNPGRVVLPGFSYVTNDILPGLVALRPGVTQAAVATPPGGQLVENEPQPATVLRGFLGDGIREMRAVPEWTLTGLGELRGVAWTGDGGRLAVAAADQVMVLAVGDAVPRPVATIPVSETLALAGGPGRDLWVADGTGIRYFAWDGAGYREILERRINGLASLRSISTGQTAAGRDALLALDGENVSYYLREGGAWRRAGAYSIGEPDAAGVALAGDGGFFVLLRDPADPDRRANRVAYYGVSDGGMRKVAEVTLQAAAWGIVTVPASWGSRDFAVVNWTGLSYYAWTGENWRRNYTRDIWGSFFSSMQRQGRGYLAEGWLYSRVWQTPIPVARVRVEIEAVEPLGTALEVEVSTDGGGTWTAIPRNTNTDVPPGNRLLYRVRLTTGDITRTPVLDQIDLRQVVYVNGRAVEMGIPVRVRLVR